MSYTKTKNIPDNSKFALSIWFRVPQSSIDAQKALAEAATEELPLQGCLPIMVFGKKGKDTTEELPTVDTNVPGKVVFWSPSGLTGNTFTITNTTPIDFLTELVEYKIDTNLGASWVVTTLDNIAGVYSKSDGPGAPGDDLDPSFIGVDCTGVNPTLVIHLESGMKPTVTSQKSTQTFQMVTNHGTADPFLQGTLTGSYIGFGLAVFVDLGFTDARVNVDPPGQNSQDSITKTCVDTTDLYDYQTGAIESFPPTAIVGDKWHHLLVSVEFSEVKTHGLQDGESYSGNLHDYVDKAAKLYVAVDDVNYTKSDLSPNWVFNDGGDNDVITDLAESIAGGNTPLDTVTGDPLPIQTYDLPDPVVGFDGKGIGLPADADNSSRIKKIEMGRLQLYLGETLDWSDVANRRLFIKEADTEGVQRPATKKTAEDFFGREADVGFFSLSSWQENGTGVIDPYHPTPNLGGKQGDPE